MTHKIIFFEKANFHGNSYVLTQTDDDLTGHHLEEIKSLIVIKGSWEVWETKNNTGSDPAKEMMNVSPSHGPNSDGCYPDFAVSGTLSSSPKSARPIPTNTISDSKKGSTLIININQ